MIQISMVSRTIPILLLLLTFVRIVRTGNCWLERDRGYSCDQPDKVTFYYDQRIGVCQPLFYRGCGGNGNRFETAGECNEKCRFKKKENVTEEDLDMTLVVNACEVNTDAKISEKVRSCEDGCPMGFNCNDKNQCCPTKFHICHLPTESGSERTVNKHYGRYSYAPGLKNCIRFSYFGAEGNYNNFLKYEDCKAFCKNI